MMARVVTKSKRRKNSEEAEIAESGESLKSKKVRGGEKVSGETHSQFSTLTRIIVCVVIAGADRP